jgi:ferredoxin
MEIDASSERVVEARKTALEMLLSEHLGDCEGPCEMACPLLLDVPGAIRAVRRGDAEAAGGVLASGSPLPRSACLVCHAPCEKACRRGRADETVSIRRLMSFASSAARPRFGAGSKGGTKRVAVVGSGPAGLSFASSAARLGYACAVFERSSTPGGSLRGSVPSSALEADIADIAALGVEIRAGAGFEFDPGRPVPKRYDALVIATGALEDSGSPPLGLEVEEGGGVSVDPATYAASIDGVFAIGAAAFPEASAIQAVADGVSAARSVAVFLGMALGKTAGDMFDSRFGALEPDDLDVFLAGANKEGSIEPGDGDAFSKDEAEREAGRCRDCDCAAADACALRELATEFGIDPRRFQEDRRKNGRGRDFVRIVGGNVVLETGKCVLCGRCVETTKELDEGLAFVGRGYDCVVSPPLDAPLDRALGDLLKTCVERCPTGALAFKR